MWREIGIELRYDSGAAAAVVIEIKISYDKLVPRLQIKFLPHVW